MKAHNDFFEVSGALCRFYMQQLDIFKLIKDCMVNISFIDVILTYLMKLIFTEYKRYFKLESMLVFLNVNCMGKITYRINLRG